MVDDYHRHESLDRCSLVASVFYDFVVRSDAVEALDESHDVRVAVEAAGQALSDAYQALGREFL